MEMSGEYPLYATLYYYDLRNRLSHVSKSGSIADFISYTLDSRGRRTNLYQYYGAYPTKDINMSYSGGTSVYERDYVMNALELVRDTTQIFYRGNDLGGGVGGLLYASNLDGTDLNYKHYNLRGDVVQTTDNSGVIQSNLYYTAFGAMTTTGTSPADSFRNNTKYRDSYGIINEGFRCRPTDSDRFLTPDPLEYIDGLNPYIYCGQNPWGRFDALGLKFEFRGTELDNLTIKAQLLAIAIISPTQGAEILSLYRSENIHTFGTPRSDSQVQSIYKNEGAYTEYKSDIGSESNGKGCGSTIIYDPQNMLEVRINDKSRAVYISQNASDGELKNKTKFLLDFHPLEVLSHEIKHAHDIDKGKLDKSMNKNGTQTIAEDRAMKSERVISKFLGRPIRKHHDPVEESNYRNSATSTPSFQKSQETQEYQDDK